jgi:hypothetical protein
MTKALTIVYLPAVIDHLPYDPSAQFTRSTRYNHPLLPLPVLVGERSLAKRMVFGEGCNRFRHCVRGQRSIVLAIGLFPVTEQFIYQSE